MKKPSRPIAVLQALFVTFLWATSWVLIKIGLRADLPAVTFAGLRYGLAFLCLLPFVLFRPATRLELKNLSAREWGSLALLGLVYYTLTQGAQYLALSYLPAAMVSLLLSLTSLTIGAVGIVLLRELPSGLQWAGVALASVGVGVYFLPLTLQKGQTLGLLFGGVCVLANTAASLLGRNINRQGRLSPLIVTFVSMGIGAAVMLGAGLATQGLGSLAWKEWAIVLFLAVVNTAFAFTLWNNTLRTLTAVESGVLNNLIMPQIVILAVIFLGEGLTVKAVIGLALVGAGSLIVQLKPREAGAAG